MNRPVFYDESGVRVMAVQWTARATCLLGGLVCLAVMATLGTHVSLPALDRLNPFAGLSQRTDADRSANRLGASEPLPGQVVNEDTRRIGTERTAVAPMSESLPERLTGPSVERSIRTAGTDRTAGTRPAKTDQTPVAAQAGPNPVAQQPPGHRARGHAGSKAPQAQTPEHRGRSLTHPTSRAAAKPAAQRRTQPARSTKTPQPPQHPTSRVPAAKSNPAAQPRNQSAKPAKTPQPSKPSMPGSVPAPAKP